MHKAKEENKQEELEKTKPNPKKKNFSKETNKLRDELNIQKTINSKLQDKNIELVEEMNKLRERFEEEKKIINKYSHGNLIKELLPTIDLFKQVVNMETNSEELKNYLFGFKMILDNIQTTFKNNGIKIIETKPGDIFDHNVHHAIETVENDGKQHNEIVEVKKHGYLLYDRLLQPAVVVVNNKEQKIKETKKESKEEE